VTQLWSAAIGDRYQSTVNDSYAGTVEGLLGGGLHVMVVSGLNDAKDCNFLGTGAWLELLQGGAADAFKAAPTRKWQADPGGPVLGFIQDGGLLSWTKVLNAGHMAVRDQPLLINLILEKLHDVKNGGQ
jgi:carboxypeptidase C (cathepsin A)